MDANETPESSSSTEPPKARNLCGLAFNSPPNMNLLGEPVTPNRNYSACVWRRPHESNRSTPTTIFTVSTGNIMLLKERKQLSWMHWFDIILLSTKVQGKHSPADLLGTPRIAGSYGLKVRKVGFGAGRKHGGGWVEEQLCLSTSTFKDTEGPLSKAPNRHRLPGAGRCRVAAHRFQTGQQQSYHRPARHPSFISIELYWLKSQQVP